MKQKSEMIGHYQSVNLTNDDIVVGREYTLEY